MKYVVKETCYWGNRYYKRGETVELSEAVTPPEHFALIAPPDEAKNEEEIEKAKKGRAVKAAKFKNG